MVLPVLRKQLQEFWRTAGQVSKDATGRIAKLTDGREAESHEATCAVAGDGRNNTETGRESLCGAIVARAVTRFSRVVVM